MEPQLLTEVRRIRTALESIAQSLKQLTPESETSDDTPEPPSTVVTKKG